ncbi:histidine kinase [Paenibacillus endoradicis]|uniref:histidine kinase n=1 Tax=Paenibacillus endoradicis TaxID=2972487 RepID=UPI002158C8CC|nr:histidine kinase [Paenibacillus endoradicis]MCR8659835.1 histidine kinase [Paenibacillus endoradicis]
MKKLIGYLAIVCALIAIIYMIFSDTKNGSLKTGSIEGELDLREMTDSAFVSLAGDWKFTANSFISPSEFLSEANNQHVPGPLLSNAQWGTYQLVVLLPDQWNEIGLRVRNIWSAHTIYVNGSTISLSGTVADSKEKMVPDNRSYEVYFTPESRQLLITIHISDFYNARSGIVFPIDIGDAQQMKEDVQRDLSLEWMAAFCLLLFCIFHITIYILRTKDEAFLFSGLYFLILTVIVITRGERLLIREFPSIPFEVYFRIQDAVTFLSSFILICFVIRMIPSIMKQRTLVLLFLPILIYSLLIIVLPARTLSAAQYFFFFYSEAIFSAIVIYIFYLTIKNRISIRKNEAIILATMLLFLVLFALSGSLDVLFFSGRNILNRVGFIGFSLAMNVFLGMRLMNRAEESELLTARLQKASDAKDDFLKVTTQDMQQPLHDAVHLIKSITREHDHTKQGEQLYLAEQLMENMVYLLRDLHDYTRIRFDDYAIQLNSTNLRMVMFHVIQLMQLTLAKKKILINEHISDQLYVWADEQRLTQVLIRIMAEISHDASGDSITIESQQVESIVVLQLTTNRTSMTASTERQHSHGLIMTEELIQQMNGSITIEHLDDGIRFTLTLALSEVKQVAATIEQSHTIQSETVIEDRELQTILIVEDDVMHAEIIKGMLSDSYKIRIAYTAQEALNYYNNHPDITMVIIDDVIPGRMNSLQLLQHFRKQASLMELPILIMSSTEYPNHIEMIFTSGANDYLIKPFSKETLMARLNAVEQTKQSMLKAIEYEMAFLQTQIKPHFLYNALSSIISFCYTDGERAAHLLSMLSSFLRYIFETSRDGQFSTLQKELEIIEAYVEVEKARFGDRLTYCYEVDPLIATENILIPNLLLQPLVENSIRHGLFEKEGPGHVQVMIAIHETNLSIQVTDNGIGMSAMQCAQLMGEGNTNIGIGFTNVRRRVHDLTQGQLEISSLLGEGTTIHITIPIKEGRKDVESNYS